MQQRLISAIENKAEFNQRVQSLTTSSDLKMAAQHPFADNNTLKRLFDKIKKKKITWERKVGLLTCILERIDHSKS